MEKKEIKPLFGELWKQLKVVCHILTDTGKAFVDRVEKTASKKVKGNPITTLIVTNSISAVLLLVTNLGWFVKYKTTVKDGDYIEMEVSKRVDQEKIRIEAEANKSAFARYEFEIDSLSQELIKIKSKRNTYIPRKKTELENVNTEKVDAVKENNVNETKKATNGDDFVEVKE